MTDPQRVSITVGVTDYPEPYRSVRVDFTLQDVECTDEGVERAVRESGPVIERLFGHLLARSLEAKEEMLTRMRGGDMREVRYAEATNEAAASSLAFAAPPPRGRPYDANGPL